MTVAADIPSFIQIPGNGLATSFAFPFKIFQSTDLIVGFITATGYGQQTGGFTVQNVDVNGGGNVVFTTPPPTGTTVDIRSVTPKIQNTEFANLGAFLPENHTEAFDRLTRTVQDLYRLAYTFGIHGPDQEGTAWTALPAAAVRAGQMLTFDGAGLPLCAPQPVAGSVTQALIGALLNPPNAAENALGVVPANEVYLPLNVKRYGAKGDGVTDDRAAIKTAWLVAKQAGGGRIVFPDGATYLVASTDGNVNLPDQNSDGSITQNAYQVVLQMVGGSNVDFDFQGSTIRSSLVGGGVLFLFDACTNIRLIAPRFQGAQQQSTGVVTLGAITGGAGYTNGAYSNVHLTGGTGNGAVAQITVAGGAVTVAAIVYPGGGYVVNDVLSCNAADIGGTGAGFSVPVTSITGAGPTVATAAQDAIVFAALTGNAANCAVHDLYTDQMFTGFRSVADPTGRFTAQQVTLSGSTRVLNGEYGVALHNAGDYAAIENLYTYRVNRPFFFYGVRNVQANAVGDQVNYGFQPIIKAYRANTRNVSVRYVSRNQPGQSNVTARLSLQVQCDPAVVPVPPFLDNINIWYDEDNVFSGAGHGIEFDYFGGAGGLTLQGSTTSVIFENITVAGFSGNALWTTVALIGAFNQCPINYDGFHAAVAPAANDPKQNGFVASVQFTYVPTIQFSGGPATGWFWNTNAVEYYISGGICHVYGNLSVNTTGSATGALTISLPLPSRSTSSRVSLMTARCANGASLSGPITGSISAGSAILNPQVQGAASAAALTSANLTATSVIDYEAHYPV